MHQWSRRFLAFVALVATLLGPRAHLAHAQAPTGRIAGVVRDSRGAPRAAATVAAVNAVTGARRATTTAGDGTYALNELAPGRWTVSASLIGTRRAERADVDVRADATTTVDFDLEPLPLQAVVVTATLREQALADVPFSIVAPTARELRERGAESLEGVAANVAGFSVQNLGPGQSQVAIRGASAGQIARDQPGVKEQAGIYLDDVPISLSLFTPDLDLFDVQRVEVLRGPQGTLFGAGSLSGTVRYITGQPELGVRTTFGEVGASQVMGGGAGGNAKVGANLPFGDRAAARIAAWQSRTGGWMDAVQPDRTVDENVNSATRTGVRAALRWDPTPAFSLVPRLVYQDARAEGWNRIDAFNILANPYTTSRPAITLGPRELFTQIAEPYTDRYALGSLNAQWNFGPAGLTSVTSFSDRDILVVRDAGALTSSITGGSIGQPEEVYTLNAPLDDATRATIFTQELRLGGEYARARWVVGGFLATADRDYHQRLTVSGFEASSGIPTEGLRAPRDVLFYSDLAYDLRQYALFGETTFGVLPGIDLTAGLRYFKFDEDRKQVFDGIFGNDDNGTALVSTPGSTSADGFAPRFIASWRPNDRFSMNAQASKGFRLGGINDPLNVPLCTPADLQTFSGRDSWRNETAWNYEVGAKSRWLGGRASLNLSAFYMDITDLQLVLTAGSCSSRLIFNTPEAVSRGIELEVDLAPSPFFDLAVSGTFNDAELRSTVTSTDASGNVAVVSGIREGNRLPSVPRVQAAAAATVRRPLRPMLQGFVTGTVNYVGSRYTQIDDLAAGFGAVDLNSFGANTIGGPLTQSTFRFDPELPAYTLVNLRVGIARPAWDLALFLNNLTDERALLALDRERGTRARVGYLTNQPRTVGVSMTFQY